MVSTSVKRVEEPEAQPVAAMQPMQSIEFAVKSPEPVTPTETAPIEVANTAASPEPTAPVVAPEAPVIVQVRLTDEMRAAGIADADFQTVTTLLLTADGWIAPGKSYGVYMAAGAQDPTQRFMRANRWVLTSYGSWTGAMQRYETNGGNW